MPSKFNREPFAFEGARHCRCGCETLVPSRFLYVDETHYPSAPKGKTERECKNCGETFAALSRPFCDESCRQKYDIRTRPCSTCGGPRDLGVSRCYDCRRLARLVNNSRKRAKAKGWEHDIAVEDLLPLPTHCPILGIPLGWSTGTRGRGNACPNTPSLDRIDNTRGYVRGNVAVISWRANSLKSDATPEESRRIVRWLDTLKA